MSSIKLLNSESIIVTKKFIVTHDFKYQTTFSNMNFRICFDLHRSIQYYILTFNALSSRCRKYFQTRNSKYERRNFESGFHPFEDIFHGEGKKKKIDEIKT